MADISMTESKQSLGVGSILSESFSIFFSNFLKVLLLGAFGALLGVLINTMFLGFNAAVGVGDPNITDPSAIITGSVLSIVVNTMIYGLVTALLIQLAYDAKLGRSNSLGTYFNAAIPAVVPIAVLSIVVFVLMMIGAVALLIGMLWVYAVFYVMPPVAVIERGGFGSLGRSAALTKEYRWPIVGLFILIMILTMVVQVVATFLVGVLIAMGGASLAGPVLAAIAFAVISGISYAFGGIAIALVYARLREIKEGVNVDHIASVFD
ncbi:MAG: hypothetical protein AAGJ74_06905 [Pseudomonadota bacterium]